MFCDISVLFVRTMNTNMFLASRLLSLTSVLTLKNGNNTGVWNGTVKEAPFGS